MAGGVWSSAQAVNNAGQVVGTSVLSGGYGRAYLWSTGIMTNLGTLGGSSSTAYGINDYGQVVGTAGTPTSGQHAFLWNNGAMTDLGTLPGGRSSYARAINASGQVVGNSTASGGYKHAFLWSNGIMADLGTLEDNGHTYAKDINASGQIVGSSNSHAILWSEGNMIDLDPISGKRSEAEAINDAGQIVGTSSAWGNARACLWSDGTMTNLGVLPGYAASDAMDINSNGQVVGWSHNSIYEERASFWSNGNITDLNSVIESDLDWQLQRAMGINDSGQIAGYGLLDSSTHAFLLTPVPSTPVTIDIKPDSDNNSINLGSNGKIPVAILSTDDFDATTVDPATITLADAGVLMRGKGDDWMSSFEDVNIDGLLDLLVHIDTQALVLDDGNMEAQLTGETFDGLSIWGTDAISLVGKSARKFMDPSISEGTLFPMATAVPEPGTLILLVTCMPMLLGLDVQRRKR